MCLSAAAQRHIGSETEGSRHRGSDMLVEFHVVRELLDLVPGVRGCLKVGVPASDGRGSSCLNTMHAGATSYH